VREFAQTAHNLSVNALFVLTEGPEPAFPLHDLLLSLRGRGVPHIWFRFLKLSTYTYDLLTSSVLCLSQHEFSRPCRPTQLSNGRLCTLLFFPHGDNFFPPSGPLRPDPTRLSFLLSLLVRLLFPSLLREPNTIESRLARSPSRL